MTTSAPLNLPAIALLVVSLCLQFTNIAQAEELTLPLADLESKATTYFMSPGGGGTLDGSSETNALPLSKLQPFIRDLKASARIVMLAGTYNVPNTIVLRSASANDVTILEGRENAVIKGDFDFATVAGTDSGFRLHSGNVIVRGLDFEDVGFCIKSNKASVVSQVLIENIDARNVHSCVLVDRDSEQDVSRWIIRNSRIKGFYRVGVRLAGAKSHDFLLDNVQIDGINSYDKSDCFKSGIQLLEGVSNVDIRNSSIANTIGSCGDDYQQGDGIEADHKGGKPFNITIDNVQVGNSGDAELDLKADNVKMHKVIVNGGDLSRYAFKVWSYRNYECTDCYAFGVHKAYINVNRGGITFRQSVFASAQPVHMCDLRHGPAPEEPSFAKFESSQMYVSNEEWASECGADALANVKRLPQGKVAPPLPVTNVQTQ